jgi:hypothetical protein
VRDIPENGECCYSGFETHNFIRLKGINDGKLRISCLFWNLSAEIGYSLLYGSYLIECLTRIILEARNCIISGNSRETSSTLL